MAGYQTDSIGSAIIRLIQPQWPLLKLKAND
jgi:hypothetical protein